MMGESQTGLVHLCGGNFRKQIVHGATNQPHLVQHLIPMDNREFELRFDQFAQFRIQNAEALDLLFREIAF